MTDKHFDSDFVSTCVRCGLRAKLRYLRATETGLLQCAVRQACEDRCSGLRDGAEDWMKVNG